MADAFLLKIVTPERTVCSEKIVSLVVPGANGYLGVLAHHAPMLAEVGIGRVTVEREDGRTEEIAVTGGFLEVRADSTTLLADAAERKEDINLDRAESAASRARARLEHTDHDTDVERAQAALARAMNRVHVASGK